TEATIFVPFADDIQNVPAYAIDFMMLNSMNPRVPTESATVFATTLTPPIVTMMNDVPTGVMLDRMTISRFPFGSWPIFTAACAAVPDNVCTDVADRFSVPSLWNVVRRTAVRAVV